MSNDLKDEKKGLPFEGLSSRPGMPADLGSINIDALAFLPNIPAKYRALMPFLAARQNELAQRHQQEKRERAEQISEFASQISAAAQREIDRNVVSLKIGGKDIDISQGDLRKIMTERAEELKEKRARLERSGGSAEEIRRLDDLIEQYDPLIERLKKGKADPATIAAVQNLAEEDPVLSSEIENHHGNVPVADATQTRRTSYSAAHLDEGAIAGPSIKDSFTRGASPDYQTQPPAPEAQENRVQQPKQNNIYEAAKF